MTKGRFWASWTGQWPRRATVSGSLYASMKPKGPPQSCVSVDAILVSLRARLGALRNIAPVALASISRMLPLLRPKKHESTRSWLNKFTRSPTIHSIVDNVLSAMFAARGDYIPAEVLLHYFAKDTSFKKIGFPRAGQSKYGNPWPTMSRAMVVRSGSIPQYRSSSLGRTV